MTSVFSCLQAVGSHSEFQQRCKAADPSERSVWPHAYNDLTGEGLGIIKLVRYNHAVQKIKAGRIWTRKVAVTMERAMQGEDHLEK